MSRYLYLIKRGPKPEWHKAPFHPVIVCDRRAVAKWQAGWTGDRAWMWEAERLSGVNIVFGGWLLVKWEGLDVDYGHIVRDGVLPDGTIMGFHHRTGRPETWALLQGAVWWSSRPLPNDLHALYGVVYATDDFSRDCMRRDEENLRRPA